jgi:hypothetical protein
VATIVRYYVKSDLSICVLSNNSAVKIGQLMDDVLFLADASSPGLADVEKLYKMKATWYQHCGISLHEKRLELNHIIQDNAPKLERCC